MTVNAAISTGVEREGARSLQGPSSEEVLHASSSLKNNLKQTNLSVPSIKCGGCIQKIERTLNAIEGVENARVNLTSKRVSVVWRGGDNPPPFVNALVNLGYTTHLENAVDNASDKTFSKLIRALAVAGFASGNIMLLSVSVWSGADSAARGVFHMVSALIALPAIVYAGQVFFQSAWSALRRGHTNMDVPISVGVILAFAMSLYETIAGGQHAYFEASVMLLFFLLIGRALEHVMRERARRAVSGLAKLVPNIVHVVRDNGDVETFPISNVRPGMQVLVTPGERVPVDGRVATGISSVDQSLVTGESNPRSVKEGCLVQAGTLNLTGTLTLAATAAEDASFLAQVIKLMEDAEIGRPVYRRIADRAARLYAPVVHIAALVSFAGWMFATGDVRASAVVAVAVLIITCPCALGLAVPMVQVVAARRLFERGIMLKNGAALERLPEVDTVVFDKTGTLTLGAPVLSNKQEIAPRTLRLAAAMASGSLHPLSKTLAAEGHDLGEPPRFEDVQEYPGFGLEAKRGTDTYRLGRAEWALGTISESQSNAEQTEAVLSKNGDHLETFQFHDPLRPGVEGSVAALKKRGLTVHLLSGDRSQPVRRLASRLAIDAFEAEVQPRDKLAYLEALVGRGHKVLMVGDGLNDAPALAAAHVAMAPGSAVDIGRNAADLVFLGDNLEAIPFALTLAQRAHKLVQQNFFLAIVYNAIALPFAAFGFVTPLIAALAMSSSSIIVVANALRLSVRKNRPDRSKLSGSSTSSVKLIVEPAE